MINIHILSHPITSLYFCIISAGLCGLYPGCLLAHTSASMRSRSIRAFSDSFTVIIIGILGVEIAAVFVMIFLGFDGIDSVGFAIAARMIFFLALSLFAILIFPCSAQNVNLAATDIPHILQNRGFAFISRFFLCSSQYIRLLATGFPQSLQNLG
jgi:hypothetical protein